MLREADNAIDHTTGNGQHEGESNGSFAELLDEYDYESPQRGQILDSIVLANTEHEIILDVGLKRDAFVSRKDLERMDEDFRQQLEPGDEVQAWVIRPYNRDGNLIVSINKALELEDWRRAQELMEIEEVVEADVIGQNKGGLLVKFGRLRGFVPNSHLTSVRRTPNREEMREAKHELVNDTLRLKVIEVNRRQDRLVMSERAAMEEMRRARLRELNVGEVITGTVVHLVDFGAFVDIGGVEGLLHISKIVHHHIGHPSEILSVGDEVEVKISKIDVERERIGLDRRALLPDPWEVFLDNYKENDLVTGTVTNVVDYGIFVAVPGGAQGLVHVNNMQTFGSPNPHDMFRQGDEVLVRIVSIDVDRKRIALSIDDVTVEEQEEWMRERREAQPSDEYEETDDEYDEEEEVEAASE